MPLPVTGSGGTVKIGPTLSAVEIKKITKWTLKRKMKTDEVGPYVNEPDIVEVEGGVSYEMDFECDVPKGGDAGQDAVLAAMHATVEAEKHPMLVFTTLSGKVVTMATPLYKEYELGTEAKSTQSFKFTVSGVVAKPTQDSTA